MEQLIILPFVLVIVCLAYKRIVYVKKNECLTIYDGLFLGGIIFILIPIVLVSILGTLRVYDFNKVYTFNIVTNNGTVVYSLSCLVLLGIISVLLRSRVRILVTNMLCYSEKELFVIILVLYVFSEMIFFTVSGKSSGSSHWYSSNELVFQKSPFYVLIAQFHNLGRFVLPAFCMVFSLKSRSKRILYLHFTVCLFVAIIELLITGNRISLLFILLSFIIPFVIHRKYKALFIIFLVSLPLVKIAEFWPMVRGLMWTEKMTVKHFSNTIKTSYVNLHYRGVIDNPLIVITEGSNLVFLNYIFEKYPRYEDFSMGQTMVLKSLGTFIPKSLWPSKPNSVGMIVGQEVAPDVPGLVLNTTILGDAWANFGYFGIVVIIFIVILFDTFYIKYKGNLLLFSNLFFVIALSCWRFDFSYLFVSTITLEVILLLKKIKLVSILVNQLVKFIF